MQNLLNSLDSSKQNNFASTTKEEQQSQQLKLAKNIDYFDSKYNNSSNSNIFIVNTKQHIFY